MLRTRMSSDISLPAPVSAPTIDAPPRRGLVASAVVAVLLTVAPGFVTMALLGSLRSYAPKLPGFWDYPSGTIGDALLVPTVIAALAVQTRRLSREGVAHEKLAAVAAGCIGFVGGAVVPLSWLFGPDTKPFWMLPRPHHYVLAGWVHAVYLSCATAAIAVLVVVCLRRLHAGRGRAASQRPTEMTLAVGAGAGMLVLIGRDSVSGGFTLSSAVTMASLLLVLLVVVGGVWWAIGTNVVRAQWRAGVLIAAFIVGLVAIIVRWPPQEPLLVGITALISFLAAFPATSAFTSSAATKPYRYPAAIAMTALATGGLVRSADAIARHEPWPVAWLVGGVIAATAVLWLVSPLELGRRRVAGYGLFLAYCVFLCYLAERLRVSHATPSSAGASVFVADMAFDVLVISLVQMRFSDLGKGDLIDIEADYLTEEEHADDPRAYLSAPSPSTTGSSPDEVTADVSLLGLAVAIGLLTMLAVAAGPLGLNRHTSVLPASRWALLAGPVALAAVLGGSVLTLGRWRAETADPRLDSSLNRLQLPRWFWIPPVLAACVWVGAAVTMIEDSPRQPFVASLGALLVLALYGNALIRDTTTLQTLQADRSGRIVAGAAGASIAMVTFWLLGFGIWHDGRPVPAGWFAVTAFAVFVGNSLAYAVAAYSLAVGLPGRQYTQQRQLARQTVLGYLGLDAAVFGVVAGVGLSIPAYAAVRDSNLHVPPLSIIASLVFMPGFVAAVVWGLKNWQHLEQLQRPAREEFGISRILLRRADGDWAAADALDKRRKTVLTRHLEFQIAGVAALLALGMLTLAAALLR